ncbi:MAG: hypothetical protein M1831_007390 [Alyxoria varia]|nr:MAG: hypothetical protein M1831_007390 [Alyxoria varia]
MTIPPFETTFNVPLTCEACVTEVSGSLYKIPGILNVNANLGTQLISIEGTAAPSAIVSAIQATGRDAILRGSGTADSASVCILETHSPTVKDYVRGLIRMVQVAPHMTIIDLSIRGLSPGTYHATIRESGDISRGPESTGGIWDMVRAKKESKPCRGILGTFEVSQGGVASIFLDKPIHVWEMIGRSVVISKQRDGQFDRNDPDTLVGVVARSAGVWDNDKTELETWVAALAHYDRNEFEESIRAFQPIADTSKILFNCGVIRATLGEHEPAIQYYQKAIALDGYLAIAFFQAGVSHFLIGDFQEALASFNDTLYFLRGNNNIDYEQLGLKFKLYSCEVLFNRGLCSIYLQNRDSGMQDLIHASKEKKVDEHNVIDDAIKDQAEGYTVFSIPVGVIYRPAEAKIRNVGKVDYLGKPQLVRSAAAAKRQNETAPLASSHRRNMSADMWAQDDRPPDKLSYAATNLVKPGIISRSRQQSEPPINRNKFPPTPPPDNEKPTAEGLDYLRSQQSRRSNEHPATRSSTDTHRESPTKDRAGGHGSAHRSHSASRAPKPGKLELGAAAFERAPPKEEYVQRGAGRSASERPAERRPYHGDTDHRGGAQPERLFGAVGNDESAEETGSRLFQEHARGSGGRSSSRNRTGPPPARSHHGHHGREASKVHASARQQLIEEEEEDDDTRPGMEEAIVILDSPANSSNMARLSGSGSAAARQFGPNNSSSPGHGQNHTRRPSAPRTNSARSNVTATSIGHGSRPSFNGGVMTGGSMRSLRVKVHFAEDTRYMMLDPRVTFKEFEDQVCRKFAVKSGKVKIRSKDEEGDLITMGDQDDWDMAVGTSRDVMKREAADGGNASAEMGKMEVGCFPFLVDDNQHAVPSLDSCVVANGLKLHQVWAQEMP